MASQQDVEISKFYMIGDNPLSDIRGGNANDCTTILVRTGVWAGADERGERLENDAENPADFVVENF